MDTYYGIDARQSINSGLRQFNPSSGFRDVFVGLGSRYIYSKQLTFQHDAVPEMGRTCIDCHKGIAHSLPNTLELTQK